MACPYCQGDTTQALDRVTALGYRLYLCWPFSSSVRHYYYFVARMS